MEITWDCVARFSLMGLIMPFLVSIKGQNYYCLAIFKYVREYIKTIWHFLPQKYY